MAVLFPDALESGPPSIPGLFYAPEFITSAEEAKLVNAIDAAVWDTTWERRRQFYGQAYGARATARPPLPSWGRLLADRILSKGHSALRFDQMLVNEYLPGQGIALHRDYDPFDATVASISLISPCVMDFRRVADGERVAWLLAPRSLLVLSDEARYQWEHGIARRKNDRWNGRTFPRSRRLSITFRRLKDALAN
jgi:alkylated DNA repair dioxygenase AlkB